MSRWIVAFLTLLALAAGASAQDANPCQVPGYMLFGDTALNRTGSAVRIKNVLI